jgi:cytochrome c553
MRCKFDMVHKRLSVLKNALRASLSVALLSSAMVVGISTSAMAADPVATKKPVDIAKGMIAQNPILAGQHAAYIEKQLVNFRLKPGAKAPERNNAIMQGFATMLSEEDMRNLGAFYASQTPKSASPKRKDLVAAGERIYRAGVPEKGLPACAGCHGPGAAGIPAQYPRLAGQHPEYTEATLNAFRGGQRKNSSQMTTIASKMSDAEVAAVSEYVASLR